MDDKPVNMLKQKEFVDDRRGTGDNFKKQDGTRTKIGEGNNLKARKPISPGHGDVPVNNKLTKTPKVNNTIKNDRVNDRGKKPNDVNVKLTLDVSSKINDGAEKMSGNKTSEISNAAINKVKIGERNVGDKIAKAKGFINQNQGREINKISLKADLKSDRVKNQSIMKSVSKEIIPEVNKPGSIRTESDAIKKEKETGHRKPMIKTVKSKNDNRVYKAVTFTEQNRNKPTVLEINIPSIQVKKTKLVDKNLDVKPASLQENSNSNKSTSKLNIKTRLQNNRRHRLTERTRHKKLNRCISSPDKFKKAESPPTEVAKWAPSCLNAHTKPYYEAWVNTTLAAISKISKADKLFLEKQNIIKTFQKSLELGTLSPDLVHENYKDECYTGKIKIKQKNVSKKTRQPLITPLLDSNKEYSR